MKNKSFFLLCKFNFIDFERKKKSKFESEREMKKKNLKRKFQISQKQIETLNKIRFCEISKITR